jgi:hypothetical protein
VKVEKIKPNRLKPVLLRSQHPHYISGGDFMAKKNRLKDAAVKIGSAVGRSMARLTKQLIKLQKRHT